MAESTTYTTAPKSGPAKPRLTLATAVDKIPKPPQPYDGLLMVEPESDYDQRTCRLRFINMMHCIAKRDGEYEKLLNWRNTPVDQKDEEVEPDVRRNDSGMAFEEGIRRIKSEDVEKTKERRERKMKWDPATTEWDGPRGQTSRETSEFGLWREPVW